LNSIERSTKKEQKALLKKFTLTKLFCYIRLR
jgi:hypothetical protein